MLRVKEEQQNIYIFKIDGYNNFFFFVSFYSFIFSTPILAEKIFEKEYLTPYIRLITFAVVPFTLLYINAESLRAFERIKIYTILQNLLPFLIALFLLKICYIYLYCRS